MMSDLLPTHNQVNRSLWSFGFGSAAMLFRNRYFSYFYFPYAHAWGRCTAQGRSSRK